MEFKSPFFALIGLTATFFWCLNYFKVGQKAQIWVPENYSINAGRKFFRWLLFFLGLLAWLSLSFSLTGPRVPQSLAKNEIEVNDILFVVDVSRSMLAEDFEPNRLEAAKQKITQFVDLMPTDRIGIIMFSEKVFTLLPLTTDLKLVKKVVGEIAIGPLGAGTNIGDAIGLATARATLSEAENKVIILLTDGVSNMGTMTPIQAAQHAKEQNLKIYTIAIGGEKDAKIPIGSGIFGKRYQTIPGGSIDVKTLQEVAKITGGKNYLAGNKEALEKVLNEISQLEKTKIETIGQVVYDEKFYPYLLFGVLLLFLVEISRKFITKEVA